MKKEENILEEVEIATKNIEKTIERKGRPVFRRYPFTFTFLSIFGFASVLYSFERMLDQVPFVQKHPAIMLFFGLILLTITGTLYKWLQNKEVHL